MKAIQKNAQEVSQSKSTATRATTKNDTKKREKIDSYDWAWRIFTAYIFNQQNPDKSEQDAARLLEEFSRKAKDHGEVLIELKQAQQHGRHAVRLTTSLRKKIRTGESESELQQWVDTQKQSQHKQVGKHLQTELNKWLSFRKQKQQQFKENQTFKIDLPQTRIVNGIHPQSLRGMQAAQTWDIYIDETGSNFSEQARTLNESSSGLGRIVALALPAGHGLAKLTKPVHATDLTHAEIQQLLKSIINSKVGVLGATMKDDLAGYNWMSAIHQLTRWVLLLLPVSNKFSCLRVKVHIENRSSYINDEQLLALQDTLESELKCLLPERFEKLILSLHIMGKNHPYNGYVDVIANCWGSPDQVKRKMLARTAWRGHCLLQTSAIARTEDIYRSISSGDRVSSFNWFELCVASLDEPKQSLLHDMLLKLGEQAHNTPGFWMECLQEVQSRTNRKDFTPNSMQTVLIWLENWKPKNLQLPDNLRLELLSMQLASSNHQGDTSLDQVSKLLPLIKKLTDENANAACQAVLRIASRSTHLYEFDSAIPLLNEWLDYPIAIPGLLNHAKLHSSLGQIYAFKGQHESALASFDLALQNISRLSDNQQIKRESKQTNNYRAIVLQDLKHSSASIETLHLVKKATNKKDETQAVQNLARSGGSLRFEHHLLLRLLITIPELQNLRQSYLSVIEEWNSEEEHPWFLIEAYRAWLLVESGKIKAATEYMQLAIDSCFENSQPMLSWMGHCLQALSASLGITTNLPEDATAPAKHYPSTSLPILAKATDNKTRLEALQVLLPFNFH